MGEYYPGTGQIIQNAFSNIAGTAYPALSPFQLNFQNAFIQEWSGDVQRQIGNTWLIDIGYVGTRGLHLVQETDPNQPLNLTSTRNASPDVQLPPKWRVQWAGAPLRSPIFPILLTRNRRGFHLSCPPGQDHEPHRAEQAGGHRLNQIHALRLEAVAILPGDSRVVVIRKLDAGHVIEGEVGDFDADFVFARLEFAGHVNRIGRTPHRTRALIVDVKNRGFADGRRQIGVRTLSAPFLRGRPLAEIEGHGQAVVQHFRRDGDGFFVGGHARKMISIRKRRPRCELVHRHRHAAGAETNGPSGAQILRRRHGGDRRGSRRSRQLALCERDNRRIVRRKGQMNSGRAGGLPGGGRGNWRCRSWDSKFPDSFPSLEMRPARPSAGCSCWRRNKFRRHRCGDGRRRFPSRRKTPPHPAPVFWPAPRRVDFHPG